MSAVPRHRGPSTLTQLAGSGARSGRETVCQQHLWVRAGSVGVSPLMFIVLSFLLARCSKQGTSNSGDWGLKNERILN